MGLEVKNPLRAQSKYSLLGSSAKIGKIFIGGSQERKRCTFLCPKHKSAIWDRTPPTYTSNLIYMSAGRFRGHKSSNRIELSRFVQELLPRKQYLFYGNFCNHPEKGGKMSQKQSTSACTRICIHSEIGKENKAHISKSYHLLIFTINPTLQKDEMR